MRGGGGPPTAAVDDGRGVIDGWGEHEVRIPFASLPSCQAFRIHRPSQHRRRTPNPAEAAAAAALIVLAPLPLKIKTALLLPLHISVGTNLENVYEGTSNFFKNPNYLVVIKYVSTQNT